jgi:hypothetical protein
MLFPSQAFCKLSFFTINLLPSCPTVSLVIKGAERALNRKKYQNENKNIILLMAEQISDTSRRMFFF